MCSYNSFNIPEPIKLSNQIRRIMHVLQPHKVLLDTPRAYKPIKNTNTPSLIVRPAPACSAERLLSHDSARAFLVVVDVAGTIAEEVGGSEEGLPI